MIEKAYACPSELVTGIFDEANEYRGALAVGRPFTRIETKTIEALVEFLHEAETCGRYDPEGVLTEMGRPKSNFRRAFCNLMDLR